MIPALDPGQTVLVELGRALHAAGYSFVTPTPETHRRVNGRPGNEEGNTLRDVFGWSRRFRSSRIPAHIFALGRRAEVLVPDGDGSDRWRSLVRFSTFARPNAKDMLFVHSAFPTEGSDSVFFGPDSYRFASFVLGEVRSARRLVDVGCGTGIGGLVLAGRTLELVLADVNPRALRFAQVNAALAGLAAPHPLSLSVTHSDVLNEIAGDVDVVIANPPYLVDDSHRLYRDGGGDLGIELAVRIADESLARMSSGGRLVLYTGTPVVEGRNVLAERLESTLRRRAAAWSWQELDPDVFGEELARAPYRNTERLAVVALVATTEGSARATPRRPSAVRPSA